MKDRLFKPAFFSLALNVLLFASAPRVTSQSTFRLDLRLYPGLHITGEVGSLYTIQYCTEMGPFGDWRFLAIVQLTNSQDLYVDTTAPAREQRFYRAVKQDLAWIPPGTFLMGSPSSEDGRRNDESPQTWVTFTRGFYMGKHEVTQGEYLAVKGHNPSAFAGDLSLPVEMVSVLDATAYCDHLNRLEQRAGRLAEGWAYRLPTEAEWEYACRAGTTTRYSYGDDPALASLDNHAWYGDPTGGRPHPVGTKLPNPWGLYDMHGNLWELCQDRMIYSGGSVVDPPPAPGLARMSRGGSWHSLAPRCRSASRNPYNIDSSEPWVGFRVVLAPVSPQ